MVEIVDPYEQAQYRPPDIQAQVNRGLRELGKLRGSRNQKVPQAYYNLGWLIYAVVLICTFGTVRLVKFLNKWSDQRTMASPEWQQMFGEVKRGNNRPPSSAPWRASRGSRLVSFYEDSGPEERQMAHDGDRLLEELEDSELILAMERDDDHWEYRLFGRVLEDELDRRAPLRREVEYRRAQTGEETYVGLVDLGQWGLDRLGELGEFVDTVGATFNDDLPQALGDNGAPGDPLEIVAVARRLAQLWEDIARWTLRCRSVRVDPIAQRAVDLLSNMNANMLDEIWDFGHTFIPRLEEAIEKHADDDAEVVVVTMGLTLTLNGADEFSEELSRLTSGIAP